MNIATLSQYLQKLEATPSRLEITSILSRLFASADTEEIDKITYLILGQLAPKYENIVFNLAERLMLQAVSEAYQAPYESVRSLYKQTGDLGNTAEELAHKRSPSDHPVPSVTQVYNTLKSIALDEGEGSQERKISKIANLISCLDPASAKFVTRIPLGKLRLGFSDKTIIDALSWMEKGDKSAKSDLEKIYQTVPDIGLLVKNVKTFGTKKTSQKILPAVGIPVLPMLAARLKSPDEMIAKMGEVSVEPKFDGLRIQLHYRTGKDGFVKAFTRNLNETSWMFPELKNISAQLKCKSAILDCEAIGIDEDRERLANFQTTMTRRRKHHIESFMGKVPITFYVFDIIFKDGKSLMAMPYVKRREILSLTVKAGNLLKVDTYRITTSPEDIRSDMQKYLKDGLEGVLVKRADSPYVPGRTGWRWVKMKESESSPAKLSDTVDCVVMGFTQGKGKRASFGIGQFLAGIPDKGYIKTVTKVGTGLTDVQFRQLQKLLLPLKTTNKPKNYLVNEKILEPDFWVRPNLVVELAADEITVSPSHSSGYALRFPRLIKLRVDKSPEQSTTLTEIKQLFKMQSNQ